jgi:hypothetical protein
MREILSSVIRDTTPKPSMKNLLQDSTIADIRTCLGFISTREQELAKQIGVENMNAHVMLMNLKHRPLFQLIH